MPLRSLRPMVALTVAVAASAVTLVPPAGAAITRDPIVFVHGYNGDASNWNTMINRFKADGYTAAELYAWDYDSSQSNVVIARQLATYVDQVRAQTGAAKVDIVGHSMGGLNSRQFLKFEGGTAEVDDWSSLGSPHHGTTVSYGCVTTPCQEMYPNSTFLKNLNAGDETPGSVRYGSWWSPCDEALEPKDTAVLSGAVNTRTACLSHTALLTDATVYGQVRDFIR